MRAPLDIRLRVCAQPRDVFRRQLAHDFRRCAENQRVVRERLAFRHDRAGTNQTVAADDRSIQDHRLNPDQRTFADRAAVQHRLVPDRHVFGNRQRKARVRMQDRAFLDVAARADRNRLVVAANRRAEPHARVLLEHDLADDGRRIGDEYAFVDRRGRIAQLVDRHGVSLSLR